MLSVDRSVLKNMSEILAGHQMSSNCPQTVTIKHLGHWWHNNLQQHFCPSRRLLISKGHLSGFLQKSCEYFRESQWSKEKKKQNQNHLLFCGTRINKRCCHLFCHAIVYEWEGWKRDGQMGGFGICVCVVCVLKFQNKYTYCLLPQYSFKDLSRNFHNSKTSI